MDLNYFHPSLTETFRHLSGGKITEAYLLPNQHVAMLLTSKGNLRGQGAILLLEKITTEDVLTGMMYAYESPAAAAFALVNWDMIHPPYNYVDRSAVTIEVKEFAATKTGGVNYLEAGAAPEKSESFALPE